MSSETFREQCNQFLSRNDAALIKYCCYDPRLAVETVDPTGSAFIDFHLMRERTLNLTLANLRAADLNRPPTGESSSEVPRAEAAARAAFEMDDPFEAENSLDRGRWGVLDEMVGLNYFGVNTIFAYLLKLQLMERKLRFDVQKGFANYSELYNAILNDYNSRV